MLWLNENADLILFLLLVNFREVPDFHHSLPWFVCVTSLLLCQYPSGMVGQTSEGL